MKFDMHNLAQEGKVFIFNKHSGEISYEDIEASFTAFDQVSEIKAYGYSCRCVRE